MSEDGRRLSAIMFTDIAGYSSLAQQNEALALALLDEHNAMLRPVIDRHHGVVIKTIGDSFMVEFASPVEALRCALTIQGTLNTHNLVTEASRKIYIRIGIHLGEIDARDNDIFGDGVNIASRIEPLADPGGICISRAVHDQAAGKVESQFISLGTPKLKNITTPIEIFQVVLPWNVAKADTGGASSDMEPANLAALEGKPQLATAVDEKSIAVLPFSNMSADPENEFFSDGITEDIITQLSKIGELMVISRTSIMRYKETTKPVREICAELGVATLLEGSVRRAGNKVRITAQLINATTDAHLWAETYDRRIDDIFAIQSDVAQQIADSLHVHVSAREKSHIEKVPTRSLEAYDAYLKGRYESKRAKRAHLEMAFEHFERALALDPNFALAWAGLADARGAYAGQGFVAFKSGFESAREAALRAIKLDDQLAEAHVSLGQIAANFDWDWGTSEQYFLNALKLKPGSAIAHRHYGEFCWTMRRFEESKAMLEQAHRLDPLEPSTYDWLWINAISMGKIQGSLDILEELRKLNPDWVSNYYTGLSYFYMGDEVNAFKWFKAIEDPAMRSLALGISYAKFGDRDKAMVEANYLIEHHSEPSSFQIGILHLAIDDFDIGFEWLERAYKLRDTGMKLLFADPFFTPKMKADPRYTALLRKMNFPI